MKYNLTFCKEIASNIIFTINSVSKHTSSVGNRLSSMNNLFDNSTFARFSAKACKFMEINDARMKIQIMVSRATLNEVGRQHVGKIFKL